MANFVSPGVYTVEKDISTYPVAGNSSIVGIVGFASKGPVNSATLITSPESLINVFGEPSEDIPGQGLEGALEILETTNSLYYVRAATDAADEAYTLVPVAACPSVEIIPSGFGVTTDLYLKAQVTDANGVSKFITPKEFRIPAGTATTQALALQTVIGGSIDGDLISYATFGTKTVLVGAFAGSGASLSVSAYSDIDFTTPIAGAVKVVFYNTATQSQFTQYAASTTTPASFLSASAGPYNLNDASLSSFIVSSNYDNAASSIEGQVTVSLSSVANLAAVSATEIITAIITQASAIRVGAVPIGSNIRIKTGSGTSEITLTTPDQLLTRGPTAFLTVSGNIFSALQFITGVNTSTTSGSLSAVSPTAVLTGSAIKVFGSNLFTNSLAYRVESLYPGAGYNYAVQPNGSIKGNAIEVDALSQDKIILSINDKGAAAETFKVGLGSSVFLENQINTGNTNLTSEYIKGYFVANSTSDISMESVEFTEQISNVGLAQASLSSLFGGYQVLQNYPATPSIYDVVYTQTVGGSGTATAAAAVETDPAFNKLFEGSFPLANGNNGYSSTSVDTAENMAAVVGSPTETPKTGLYALDYDDLNISIATIPGINNQTVQNALITLAEDTQNFIALVAPPYGAINTPQEAIDWTNGKSETRTAAVNSSYAAVHWPWVKVFSVFDGIDRWYDPSIFAARQMCFTDSVSDPWFAPAGFRRGRLTKPIEVEVNLNQGDRDSLYSGGNIINPIVSFPQAGIAIFGQRTAQRTPTALDRINVRRLMIFLRKAVLNSTQSFVFEPNDPFTWEAIRDVINPLLEDIRSRRGIINYSVICDETTNTPVRVDRNELWCKVVIQPTKSAEVIVFELNVTNQSAQLGG